MSYNNQYNCRDVEYVYLNDETGRYVSEVLPQEEAFRCLGASLAFTDVSLAKYPVGVHGWSRVVVTLASGGTVVQLFDFEAKDFSAPSRH